MAAGYMGRVLFVDLDMQEIETRELDTDVAKNFIGGMGLNAWLMKQSYMPGTDPLAPDNPIILGAGPLVGTGAPGAAKIVATTRFPLNGTISESVGSMRFARNLKGAGFDHVVIKGRARKPTVLEISEDGVSFLDASDLWGLDAFTVTDALKKIGGSPKISVIAIGPAGENQVAFSLAMVDKASTLGRGGLGAVMGSKNLKAITAKGSARPVVSDGDELSKLLGGIRDRLKRFKNHKRVLELGIMENWDNYVKQLSAYRNFTHVFSPQKANELYGPSVYKTFRVRRFGCPSCFTPDKDILEITQGPYKGFKTTTTSYFNSYSVGRVFDLNSSSDKTAAVRMTDLLDKMGLDMLSFSTMMDFLITECEQGHLDSQVFDIPLQRDMNALAKWARAISTRKGKADALAGGWRSLLSYLGSDFERYAPIIKNCDILWDPRLVGLGTMEFEQIVSVKGPRSASGGSPTYVPGQPEENLPLFGRHLDRMGADSKAIDRILDSPFGFSVGRMTRYSEDWYTVLTSLGICNRHFNNRFYSFELCHRLFVAVTGFQIEIDEFRESVVMIWNTIKGMNISEGFGPEDDRAPELWFSPMIGPDGESLVIRDYFGRQELTREDIDQFVRDYYDERGWGSDLKRM